MGFEQSHIDTLAENMREADKREIDLALGLDPLVVLQDTLRVSWFKRMAYREEDGDIVPVAFFGIATHPEEGWVGIPWMLAAEEAYRYKLSIVRLSKDFMQLPTKRYGMLENHVHFENEKAIKLLKHLGFTVDEPEPWGVQGALFRRFHWSR